MRWDASWCLVQILDLTLVETMFRFSFPIVHPPTNLSSPIRCPALTAGKSTTVAMMTRHTPPTRGNAFVMGHSVRTDFTRAAQCMGVVTQDNSLYGELDSVEHLWLFARIRGVPDSQVSCCMCLIIYYLGSQGVILLLVIASCVSYAYAHPSQ
jgi:hypothetical protein